MLRTFTQNDQLQEQYRLQEEWLRVQRTEEYARQKLRQDYYHALKMKEQAEKEKYQAFFILQEKDAAIQEKDAAIQENKVVLQEKDAAIQEKDAAIQEKDAAIQEKNQEIIRLKQMLESKLDGTTS